MNPRDLPEVVSELIIEMHEVRSELKGLNGRVDRLERRMEGVETEVRLMREENRQNTDRLIDAFGKSMAPLIDRVLAHESRLGKLENPE
jgi:predicted nuclease with TOPRIM domain